MPFFKPKAGTPAPADVDIALSDISRGKQKLANREPAKTFDVVLKRSIDNSGPAPKFAAIGVQLLGHRLTGVVPDGAADKCKLRIFDKVTHVDGVALIPGHPLAKALEHKRTPRLTIERPAPSSWLHVARHASEHLSQEFLGAAVAVVQGDLDALVANVDQMTQIGVDWSSRQFTCDDISALQLLAAASCGVLFTERSFEVAAEAGMHLVELALQYNHPEIVHVLLTGAFADAPEFEAPPPPPSGKGKGKCHHRSNSGSSVTSSASSSFYSESEGTRPGGSCRGKLSAARGGGGSTASLGGSSSADLPGGSSSPDLGGSSS